MKKTPGCVGMPTPADRAARAEGSDQAIAKLMIERWIEGLRLIALRGNNNRADGDEQK